MAPVIICAHCVPVLKNILLIHTGPAVDHHITEANCCCSLTQAKLYGRTIVLHVQLAAADIRIYPKTFNRAQL